MSADLPPILGLIDGIPASELLDGLASLHQSVVVTDPDGVVLWASRDLEQALGGPGSSAGLALASVCESYLRGLNDVSRSLGPENLRRDLAAPYLQPQIANILEQLAHRESVCHYRIEPHWADSRASTDSSDCIGTGCTALEIHAFGVDTLPNSEQKGLPHINRLYVTILRPAPKLEARGSAPSNPSGFYKDVLDRLPEATLTIDTAGFITYANAGAVSLLERTSDELIDTPVSLYLPSSSVVEANAPRDAQPGQINRSVIEFEPTGQALRFIEVTSRSLDLPDGTYAGRILQLRDTTTEQNISEQLRQKIASLETYVHSVSHDLRSPLVSLLGFTRLMKIDYGEILGESGRRFLDRIEQAGCNMNDLTRDLLELSTRTKSSSASEAADPLNVLRQIQAEVKPRLEEQGIELRMPTVPPMIQCDRTQLYQVFSNLIGNAIQHMGPCEAPRIEVEIQQRSGQRIIVVRDNGRGIVASEHERIFDAFHSISRDDGTRSTGVGLAIVKKIALSYKGRVWVESEPGQGAAFFVSLKHR